MTAGRCFAERVTRRRLASGGVLAVLTNPHAPTVTIAGTLSAGPALAADGRFSVPALTAAMLDRGTASLDRMQIARELEDHGLQLAVRASAATPTIVSFSAQGLAEELPRLVRLTIEVLRRPTFPAPELAKLREQVLGGLARERQETHALAFAALTRRLFPAGHPLSRRPIEDREREVGSVSREDLASFHDAAYHPSSLVLAVVGDVEPGAVESLIGQAVDGWQGAGGVEPQYPDEATIEIGEDRIQIADRPNLDVFLGHRAKLLRGDPDYPAAVLANSCLGQSTLTSRLGVTVRDREGLTYGIYSRFFGTLGVAGPWAVSLGVSAENLERAVELSRSVISVYVAEGPTEEELADERSALAGAYRVGLATNGGVARELVTTFTAGESLERLDRFPEELLGVDRGRVMDAIRDHLHPDRLVMTAAGDFGQDVQSLER